MNSEQLVLVSKVGIIQLFRDLSRSSHFSPIRRVSVHCSRNNGTYSFCPQLQIVSFFLMSGFFWSFFFISKTYMNISVFWILIIRTKNAYFELKKNNNMKPFLMNLSIQIIQQLRRQTGRSYGQSS